MKVGWMMMVLLAAPLTDGAALEKEEQKLRSLVVLPRLNATVMIQIASVRHPELGLGKAELERQIAVLHAQLKDNPNDGTACLRLEHCLEAAGRTDEAERALKEAVRLLRSRAETQPQDGSVQGLFAEALVEDDKLEEAERVLRNAVKTLPYDWVCWAGLGDLLDSKFYVALGWPRENRETTSFMREVKAAQGRNTTAAQLEEAESCQHEADGCFVRAVRLAPRDPEPAVAHAVHRSKSAYAAMFKAAAQHQDFDIKKLEEWAGSSGVCAAWAAAVKLSPTNYTAVGYWGLTEALLTLRGPGATKPIETLSETRRAAFLDAMRLLEAGADHPNPRLAAVALECLGILRWLATMESPAARTAFRKSATLDPSRRQAWEGLVLLAAYDDKPQEVASVCEERLKYDDTVRNHVWLAKALDRAGQTERALAQARTAVALDRKDAYAQFCLGALLLRRLDDPTATADAKEHLSQGVSLLQDVKDDDERAQLGMAGLLDMAILSVLEGEDKEKVRQALRGVASMPSADQRDKERAKEIDAAMGN